MTQARTTLLILLLLAFHPADNPEQLARTGSIDVHAPVQASSEITINAPPSRVWNLLTSINDWPTWQHDITAAHLDGPLQAGTDFTWSAGTSIHSRLALVQPPRQVAWTGKAYNATAIHVWTLEPLPSDRTLVKTSESMSGFLLTVFFSSAKLHESQQHWLVDLKAAAERHPS